MKPDTANCDRLKWPRGSHHEPPCGYLAASNPFPGIGASRAGLTAVGGEPCPLADMGADLALANNVIAALPDPFLLLDRRLRIRFANAAFYGSFSGSPADNEGRSIHSLCNGQWNIPELRRQLTAVLNDDLPIEGFEVDFDLPGDEARCVQLTAHRVARPGASDLILVGMHDITECKREQACVLNADRRKDEFLAMVCHELRTPLAPILSAVELLQHPDHDGSNDHRAHRIIERQVAHMKRLISELLDTSQIGTGRVRLESRPAQLGAVLERSVERVAPMLEAQAQVLELVLPDEPIWLDADVTRLEQVIGNLLVNASKYSERETAITLTVTADEGGVVIRVADQGIGIAPELLPDIFRMFSQASGSLHRSQGGLGIGLALAEQLVNLHGGTIEAHSDGVGEGSEFFIRLPRIAAPERALEPQDHAATRPLRVLVVDDHAGVADVSAMLLRTWGHDASVARCGAEALEQTADLRPDVILLDVGLPDIDGHEVARRIRGDERYGTPIIVAVTGYGQEGDFARTREAGFDAHLVKPIALADLETILADAALPTPASGTVVLTRSSRRAEGSTAPALDWGRAQLG